MASIARASDKPNLVKAALFTPSTTLPCTCTPIDIGKKGYFPVQSLVVFRMMRSTWTEKMEVLNYYYRILFYFSFHNDTA
jgi:hypothetical protein